MLNFMQIKRTKENCTSLFNTNVQIILRLSPIKRDNSSSSANHHSSVNLKAFSNRSKMAAKLIFALVAAITICHLANAKYLVSNNF
jgi:hypothetical protein